jgi:DNA polymerase III epsilon subunit-like protein
MKTVKQQTPDFGLCIDWETTGAEFGDDSSREHQGISCAAIIFSTKDFSPVEELHFFVKFDEIKYKWTEGAQKIHGLTKEFLAANGISQEEGATKLVELVLKYFGPGGKVMFLGHNPIFDIRFTNQLLASIEFILTPEPKAAAREHPSFTIIEMHHVVLDTSALGFITLGLFKSDLLFDKIGGEAYARGDHDAKQDARMTLETCQAVRKLVEIALEPV